jgi:hypothetical protein
LNLPFESYKIKCKMMFLNQMWMCVLVQFYINLVSIAPCFILFESFMFVLKCCFNVQRWMNNKNLPNQKYIKCV